jgi:hypothetical protein
MLTRRSRGAGGQGAGDKGKVNPIPPAPEESPPCLFFDNPLSGDSWHRLYQSLPNSSCKSVMVIALQNVILFT